MKVLVKGRKGCVHVEHIEMDRNGHEIGRCLFCQLVRDYAVGSPAGTDVISEPNLVTVYFEELRAMTQSQAVMN